MGYKLAIAAVLAVAVSFTMKEGAEQKEFKFTLTMDRVDNDEWQRRISNDQGLVSPALMHSTLRGLVRDWQDQALVIDDETGQPAAFSEGALDALFNVPGLYDVVLSAYTSQVVARIKN